MLHSICQQIWKIQQWPQGWKRSVFIPIPKKGNAKEWSNYHTIALISHASQVMLKILQAFEEKPWPPRQHIKKHRDCFADKGPFSESYNFSNSHVWMWELDYKESWAPKNWWFWIVVLENSLERPWIRGRSNQSFLKEISPNYSLEGLMLNLKLQYCGHLMGRTDSLEKTPILGKIEVRRRRVW